MIEQFTSQGFGYAEHVLRRRAVGHLDGDIGMQAMADPARLGLGDSLDAPHMLGGMMDFVDDAGLDAV
ncbi:MAG: hypothetical protein E5Y74_32120 [Mesorhizobium sp.]|nr:MAG: hypothetical protein E5Y74_32120 [Mesorhizobium sp.]